MKKRSMFLSLVALAATVLALMPAGADPLSQRDMGKVVTQSPKRFLPSEAGKKEQLTFLFGPYSIPPGQDSNRITADFQLPAGFVTSVSPDLVDAASGRVPTEQEAHIHHAHWFRVTDDPNELYYLDGAGLARGYLPDFIPPEVASALPNNAGISWVFGTGEEKTQGGFELREALDDKGRREDLDNDGKQELVLDGPDGIPDQRYGLEVDQAERQLLIYMIHNKTSQPLNVFVVLDVEFTHGTAPEIEAATGIPMHALKGQLFGRTSDATRQNPTLVGGAWNAEIDGTAIVSGGHSHPGAYGVFLTNQGPDGKCKADADNDGFPGVTILRSRKIDHVPGSWPYSEDFQMGVAKYGWRAPVHKGDKLEQYGVYDIDNEANKPWLSGLTNFALPGNYPGVDSIGDTADTRPHQHFEAMNHVGIYIDPQLAPTAYSAETDEAGCPVNFLAATNETLLGADTPLVQQRLRADVTGDPYYATGSDEGMQNHTWPALDPTCGDFAHATRKVCENGEAYATDGSGVDTDTILISGFQYAPGQFGLPGAAGSPARVKAGSTVRIVNLDAAANVRHTLTTCPWPCTGVYVSNYPFQDGVVDTGKLGNVDPIDGGLTGDDTVPVYELDLAANGMGPGFYSYYCRIHPFMRGALEVVA